MSNHDEAKPKAWGLRALASPKLRPTVILVLATPLLLSWRYFGTASFYREHFATGLAGMSPTATAEAYRFLSCLVLLGIVPALVVKLLFRQRLGDYGVRLGIRYRTIRSLLIMGPFFLAGGYLASLDPAVRAVYPVDPQCGGSSSAFVVHAAMYFTFYLGWEFFFRGFMLVGLSDAMGAANAILIQTLASCLMHIGDPASEAFSSMIGAVLWGVLAVRTKSLLSGTLQHSLLGISLDWFILRHG